VAYRDDLEAAHARIAALEEQLAGGREILLGHERAHAIDRRQLADALEAERRTGREQRAELARIREERERLVTRVRSLQDELARANAEAARNRPPVFERGAPPICPRCRALLLRDEQLVPGVCPQCASITLLRR
jgi:cell division septum initiation protein DivIVA